MAYPVIPQRREGNSVITNMGLVFGSGGVVERGDYIEVPRREGKPPPKIHSLVRNDF